MSEIVKEVKRIDSATVVVAQGEVTIEQSPAFHRALVDICAQSPKRLVIDLSGVSYIDSSGVGTLVEIFRRVNRGKGKMFLVGMTPTVRSVFEITKLDQFFPIFATEQEALEA